MADNKDPQRRIDADLVRRLAALLEEVGLTEIEYGEGDWRVRVAKNVAAPITFQSQATAAGAVNTEKADESEAIADHRGVVVSPMVGVIYTSDEPDAAPFVKVGDEVMEGDTLLLIEAMKVFNQIKAPRSGKIIRILVSKGMPVEFGEPLLIIE